MQLEKETQKEIGKAIIDVGKYVITVVVIATLFKSFDETWMILVGILSAAALFVLGFLLFNKSNKKK